MQMTHCQSFCNSTAVCKIAGLLGSGEYDGLVVSAPAILHGTTIVVCHASLRIQGALTVAREMQAL